MNNDVENIWQHRWECLKEIIRVSRDTAPLTLRASVTFEREVHAAVLMAMGDLESSDTEAASNITAALVGFLESRQ